MQRFIMHYFKNGLLVLFFCSPYSVKKTKVIVFGNHFVQTLYLLAFLEQCV